MTAWIQTGWLNVSCHVYSLRLVSDYRISSRLLAWNRLCVVCGVCVQVSYTFCCDFLSLLMKSAGSSDDFGPTEVVVQGLKKVSNFPTYFRNLSGISDVTNFSFLLRPREQWRSIVMSTSVCLSVCPQRYLWSHISDLYQFFCACCLWPWLGPPLAG